MIRASKKKFFTSMVTNKNDPKSIWKTINALTKKEDKSNIHPVPPDVFNNHFTSIGNRLLPASTTSSMPNLSELRSFCRSKTIKNELEIPYMTILDVMEYLSSMKNKNSAGLDGFTNKIIRICAPYIADTLTFIYNLCLSQNVFPLAFKHAKVVPLYKSGDREDVNNYRPISLLSSLSKPLERHIFHHISKFTETNKLFHDKQSGFRTRHSCHSALSRMSESWLNDINNSKLVGAVFVDFCKAFDLINHDILLQKLKVYSFHKNTVQLLQSYLSDRTQTVILNGRKSSPKKLCRCVPQ